MSRSAPIYGVVAPILSARLRPDMNELRRKDVPAKEVAAQLNMKTAAVHKAYSRVKAMLREEVALLLKQSGDSGASSE